MNMVTDPATLGAAIREARLTRGWTQLELASAAGVSRPFVIGLERAARPRAELIRVLAVLKALNLAVRLVADERGSFDDVLGEVLG